TPQRNRKLTLKGFSQGLKADLGVAHLFADKGSDYLRGIAAPLFYASANRLLLMTGGERAKWTGNRFEVQPEGGCTSLKVKGASNLASPTGTDVYVAGTPVKFMVEALDGSGAHASGYRGTIRFESTDGQAVLPQPYVFTEDDAGMKVLEVTFKQTGPQSLF